MPPRVCDLCICGNNPRPSVPRGLPASTPAVLEDWLLKTAEDQEAVPMDEFLVPVCNSTSLGTALGVRGASEL